MTGEGYSLSDIATVTGGGGRNNDGGFGGDWGAWIILFLLFGLFGRGGFGGFGGNGGGGNSGGGGGCGCCCATRADIDAGFALNNLQNGINSIQNGICDSTYALTNAINGGFAGVERGFCGLSAQLAQCCCDTKELIGQVRYDLATQACDTRNLIQNTTRDIIEGQNANTRAILDFLTQDKIATLTAENQSLRFQASQTAQNAFITANQEAQTAELIRRLGADCPVPAYVVNSPTPVSFPTNSCGQVQFANYGNNCGCGCGCGGNF